MGRQAGKISGFFVWGRQEKINQLLIHVRDYKFPQVQVVIVELARLALGIGDADVIS